MQPIKISIITMMDPPATAMAMIVIDVEDDGEVGVAVVLAVFAVVVTGVEDADVVGVAVVLPIFAEVVSVIKDGVICVLDVESIIGDL
jgi:hypothetical protein